MSYYLKRMTVLKQVQPGFSMTGKPLSGLAKAEKTGANVKITLSLVNVAKVSEGAYYLAATGGGEEFCFFNAGADGADFSKTAKPYIDIESGFTCLLCFAAQSRVVPVAYGGGLNAVPLETLKQKLIAYLSDFESTTSDFSQIERRQDDFLETPKEDFEQGQKQELSAVASDGSDYENRHLDCYQDEIVATDNYYLYGDVDIDNLAVKEKEQFNQPIEAEKPSVEKLFSDLGEFDKDGITQGNYFDKVQSELTSLFESHPRDTALEQNIPDSKWVRIFYSDDKYYTVGLINDDKQPAYICYGVPGKYSKEPPSELKGFCSYLPLSLFDLKGDGYWMMYQNAKTGECVHIDFI